MAQILLLTACGNLTCGTAVVWMRNVWMFEYLSPAGGATGVGGTFRVRRLAGESTPLQMGYEGFLSVFSAWSWWFITAVESN